MMHYDKLVINQAFQYQEYLDHIFYTIPLQPQNWQNFTFPSTYVGSWSAAKAIEYLYSTSSKHKNLIKDNTILISKEYNSQILEELITEERIRFRETQKIGDSTNVFYICPGNKRY